MSMRRPLQGRVSGRIALAAAVLLAAPLSIVGPAIAAGTSTRIAPHGHWHHGYWWRLPLINHTVNEEFFLLHMRTMYGADWLRWMSDPVIEAHWHRFLMRRLAGL